MNEPVASTSWAYNLSIPTRFSSATMESIETKVLTGKARDEIIASLSTVMLLYTTTPTSSDYNIICDRLVKKIPVLKDVVGSGYVSWCVMHTCTLHYLVFFTLCIRTHGRKN